jgi:divalent metal cation (Fe/Co/Zn/Cd) transporter
VHHVGGIDGNCNFVVNITIGVNGSLTVEEGDRIATEVEQSLRSGIELCKTVYVHFHPTTRNRPVKRVTP